MGDSQLMPPLRLEEYEALKADIAKRGVLVPIVVDVDTGQVIDGFHRLRACQELGIKPPVNKRHFATDKERKEHALILNLLRRHLGPTTWAQAFERLLKVRGVERERGGDRRSAESKSNNRTLIAGVAQELGVSRSTAFARLKLANDLTKHPDLAEKVDTGEMAAKRALRVKREREAEARRREAPLPPSLPPTIQIYHCDFRELDVKPDSVDLIFTDPPYAKKYLSLWSDLAEFAKRVLKPGKLMVAYSGHTWLLEILDRLREHLTYVWLGAVILEGPHYNAQHVHIWSKSKPLLFFSKGDYEPDRWFYDTVASESRQKDEHEWQQGIGPAKYYIEALTQPGELVVDPFLGSGTTALAGKELRRVFIGCDIDPRAVETTRRRIHTK